jgi:hypothetical protein
VQSTRILSSKQILGYCVRWSTLKS